MAMTDSRYVVADEVAWVDSVEGQATAIGAELPEELQPEAWVAVVPDGQPLSLNGSGLLIWRALHGGAGLVGEAGNAGGAGGADGAGSGGTGSDSGGSAGAGWTVAEITVRVREMSGVDNVPEADVAEFVAALVHRGLLTVHG